MMTMMLTRFSRPSLAPRPSSIYFACQKYINKLYSRGSEGHAEITNFPKDSSGLETANRVIDKSSSLNGENSNSTVLQTTFESTSVQTKYCSKKLKLLLKGSRGSRKSYIINKNVAETLVTYLKRDLGNSDIIVDSSPGLGLLIETILSETANPVVAYEPNSNLRSYLEEELLPQNSSRLQIQTQDFAKLYGYYIISQKDPENLILQNFLQPMLRKKGSEFLPVKIVGVAYDTKFIYKLIFSYSFQCSIFGEISPDLYLYIPFDMYCAITFGSNHAYSSFRMEFNYFFDMEILHVVSNKSFAPNYTKKRKKRTSDDDNMYLVKISPNKQLLQKVSHKELENFHYFVNTVSRLKKTESLITGLERWVPDCGPKLIKNGLHVFAHPRDLTPEQLLQVYKIFINLPSYQESTFHYQRQQFIARFAEKDEEMSENKSVDETIDFDDDDEFIEP